MAATHSNNRASLLNGLRTGGVRSTSMSVPHTAALGGSFNVQRFASNSHSPFAEEDDMDEVAELFSQSMYINNQARPLTAAVDGPNNRFVQQQMAAQSALNPNSVPFYPSYSQGMQPQSASDVQLHAYQQMQMMQLEIARLQSEQAQRNARAQAILIQHALRQQMQNRSVSVTNPPATAGPLETSFDIRPVSGSPPARRPSQAELLKAQLGVQTPPLEDQVSMTAALGGRVGARVTSSVAFPSIPETPLRGSSPPGLTTVISGGTSLGNSLPNGNGHTIKDSTPSKSDVAVSWRRGSTTNSVLNGLRTVSAVSPSVKITPPPGERISPPPGTTSANKVRPRPLSFTAPLSRTLPAVVLDSGSEHDDAYSTSSSASLSNPTTPHSASSLDTSPLSPREEAAKKLYEGLGMGRPILSPAPVPVAHKFIGPFRQPRGPPSGADELGPKNFATRVRRKAIGGLGVLMGARERREAIEAY